jgi:hypothetical protein
VQAKSRFQKHKEEVRKKGKEDPTIIPLLAVKNAEKIMMTRINTCIVFSQYLVLPLSTRVVRLVCMHEITHTTFVVVMIMRVFFYTYSDLRYMYVCA